MSNLHGNKLSDKLWLILIILPALIPTTNAGLHYIVAILISSLIMMLYKTNKYFIFSLLIFSAYLITSILFGSDLSSLRYCAILIVVSQLRFIPIDSLSKAFYILIILNTFWAVFELYSPNNQIRLLFRSSLQEFHVHRASGLFAFPGDLGHFAVTLFTFFIVLKPQIYQAIKHNWLYWFIGVLCCLFLLAVSQSRLAFIQLFIALVLISLRQGVRSVLIIGGGGALAIVFFIDFDYLLSTDWVAVYDAISNIGSQSKFKRVSDVGLLFSGQTGLLPAPLPSEIEFVESGFVSQFFRIGGFMTVFLFLAISISCAIGFFKAQKGSLLLATSIICVSLLATNFVGAPFERPKLMYYSAIFLSLLFHLTYKIRTHCEETKV